MSQWDTPGLDEEEEEEETTYEGAGHDREHTVFLVDTAPAMFDEKLEVEEGAEPKSSFNFVMITIGDFMRKKIVTGAKDEFAVVFYNTAKSENPMKHPNVYVYIKRDQPDANMLQAVGSMTDKKFFKEIGHIKVEPGDHTSAVQACDSLRYALWTTMDTLQAQASKSARYRIIMFSNTEDPIKGLDPSYRMLVLDRAVPLKELGATLRFFPLIMCKKPFDMSLFWQALQDKLQDPDDEFLGSPLGGSQFSQALQQAPQTPADVMERLICLAQYMNKALQKRRATTTLRWEITEDLAISVQVFDLFMEAKKPFAIKLRAEDAAVLQADIATISEDTGETITKVEYKQFRPEKVQARFPRVVLKVDDVQALKYYLPAGLKLLGFKPRSCLKDHQNMTHSSFLRPTEKDVKGSCTVFRALLDAMAKKNNVAICRYVRTKRTEPCLVALLPQKEVLDEGGYQTWAEGLHMIRLPFKDDIRAPEMDPGQVGTELPTADPDQVEAARQVISSLQYEEFALGAVPNPALARHFEVLESLAMHSDPPAEVDFEDATIPPAEIDKLAGAQLKAFNEAVQLGVGGGGVGSKRKAAGPELSTAEAYGKDSKWQELAREGKLSKLTLPDLKVYLKFNKMSMSGNKADIVQRILDHLHREMP